MAILLNKRDFVLFLFVFCTICVKLLSSSFLDLCLTKRKYLSGITLNILDAEINTLRYKND